jgi:hypothetical protein
MKLMLGLVLLVAACGSGSSEPCGDIASQNCGPTYSVTMKYAATAGNCTVVQSMPAVQFHYAVVPTYRAASCNITDQSATTWTVDCSSRGLPPGCSNTTCAWVPPVVF